MFGLQQTDSSVRDGDESQAKCLPFGVFRLSAMQSQVSLLASHHPQSTLQQQSSTPRFCVGDRFYLCDNKILCENDYEDRLLMQNGIQPRSLQQHNHNNNNLHESINHNLKSEKSSKRLNHINHNNNSMTTFNNNEFINYDVRRQAEMSIGVR